MGFWDFIAPDFSSFRDALAAVVPPVLAIPEAGVLTRDQVIAAAWANPASGAGLATRIYYELHGAGGSQTLGGAAWLGVINQAAGVPGGEIIVRGTSVMSALVIANVYRCSIEMQSAGHPIVNVVHVLGTASGQQAAAAAAVLAAWKVTSGPLSQLSSLVAMTQVTAMDLSSLSGGISIVTDTTVGGKTTTNSLATRGACALVKLNGGTRSRTSRGRLYLGPIMESDVNSDGATLVAGAVTNFTNAMNAFISSLSGASFTLGVASRKTSTFTSAGTHGIESTIATQRRRIRS